MIGCLFIHDTEDLFHSGHEVVLVLVIQKNGVSFDTSQDDVMEDSRGFLRAAYCVHSVPMPGLTFIQ